MDNHNLSEILRQFLNVYWLRPETALWRAIDVSIMEEFEFYGKSMDLGCGDGIFSFIRAGGEFGLEFDAFQSIDNLDLFYQKVDIYDSIKNELHPIITRKPSYRISTAFDHKESLLKKANTLGLYENLMVGDANNKLPFEEASLNSAFSNIIYWLNQPELAFKEIYRVLQKQGRCCAMLPNSSFAEYSFYNNLYIKQDKKEWAFLDLIDRGRLSDNIKHAKPYQEWKIMIEDAGFKVVQHKMHLSKPIIQIWDIGLRPIFPLLYKMTSNINKENLLEIKGEWIDTFMQFMEPLMYLDENLCKDAEPAFHMFILEK